MAKAFSIPVYFNGEAIERPDRLDNPELSFMDSSVGPIHLQGMDKALSIMNGTLKLKAITSWQGYGSVSDKLYFQGLPVGSHRLSQSGNIVHLDESLFKVRMPDRDVLIDHQQQEDTVSAEVKRAWKNALVDAKEKMSAKAFVDQFFSTLKSWGCATLLNDVPFLPSNIVYRVTEEPFQERPYREEDLVTACSVSKEDLDKDKVKMLMLPRSCDDESITEWQYAYHGEFLCCDFDQLDADHWAMSDTYKTQIWEEDALSVSMVDPKDSTVFNGDWCWFNAYPGALVLMSGPLGKVEVTNACIYVSGELVAEVVNGELGAGMYIPAKALEGSDIAQSNNFNNNDDYDESAAERESMLFSAFLLNLNVSPDEALMSLLNNSGISMLQLAGKSISVDFNDDGKAATVQIAA